MGQKVEKPKIAIRRPPVNEADDFVRSAAETSVYPEKKEKKKRKQVTLHLSPDVFRRLKVMAAETDREMSEIAETALLRYFDVPTLRDKG